jgi:8-oxo-dGTP pyrophosphatase MutT (NUDIX family)
VISCGTFDQELGVIKMEQTHFQSMLEEYRRSHEGEGPAVERMLDLSMSWPDCFSRHFFAPGHFTGSAWVTDPAAGKVLLTHHRRLDAWLQLGGHGEGETDIRAIALREAEEESGLPAGSISPAAGRIFDIDIHPIPPGKGEPAHEHFDLRFHFYADSRLPLTVSDESHDLAWVELDRLEDYTREESLLRMRRKLPISRAAGGKG